MAILLQNNLDVGPAGTAISVANSDDNGDDPFNVVDLAGTARCHYVDAANRPTAAYVAEFATFSGASRSPSCEWTVSLGTHFWTRIYARFNTTPPTGYFSTILATYNGSTIVSSIGVSGNDPTKWIIRNEYSSYGNFFYPYTVTLGEWVRIEAEFAREPVSGIWAVDATLNASDLVDSDVVGLQAQMPMQGIPGPATIDSIAIGYPIAHTNYEPVWISGFAVSTDGWIGPVPRQVKGVPGVLTNFIAPHTDAW
jgi:hypothetical protein